jgi:nucleoredoxin
MGSRTNVLKILSSDDPTITLLSLPDYTKMWADDVLGPTLLVKVDDNVVSKPTAEVLSGKKFVLFYFSAHWCMPCRKFTPLLSVTYEDLEDKSEVEVVFVSADEDKGGFDEYYGEMPWAAVPFVFEKREDIGEKYGVSGIPRCVVLNAQDGTVVNGDARAKIVAEKKLGGIF